MGEISTESGWLSCSVFYQQKIHPEDDGNQNRKGIQEEFADVEETEREEKILCAHPDLPNHIREEILFLMEQGKDCDHEIINRKPYFNDSRGLSG